MELIMLEGVQTEASLLSGNAAMQAGVEENSFTASPLENCFSFHNQ